MAVGVLVVLFFSCSLAFAVMGMPDPANRHVLGELIVGFYPQASLRQIDDVVSSIGGMIIAKHTAPKARITRIKLPAGASLDEVIANLKSNPAFANVIMYVEPNMVRQAMQVRGAGGEAGVLSQSGDPFLVNQWGYYDIGAQLINAPSTTAGITVAVIDTGVDYTHPDLASKGKVIKGYDFVNADKDPMDDFGHGTHVSGIIAATANNNYGITGVSWNAKIYAIKALDSTGYGNSFDIALAIIAAGNSAAKVINMSLGGGYSYTEELAVAYAVDTKGKLLVAAAGNSNTNVKSYPAGLSTTYPGRVLAVAAHDETHCRASFSNYGNWVSISAPGVNILSTLPPYMDPYLSGFAVWDGTSMAAPHVAGAAALAWGKYPTYTNVQIANVITSNASTAGLLNRNGTCWPNDGTTFGRLDVLEMLEETYYEACSSAGSKGRIYGYAFNAETGLPLAGAKVTASPVGSTTTGINYVPYIGTTTFFSDDSVLLQGYGLFNVLTLPGNNTLKIQKTKYITFSPKDEDGLAVTIPVNVCQGTLAGNIPVPPTSKSPYWLAITWNQGYAGARYDLYTDFYLYGSYYDTYFYANSGSLNLPPYVKLLWDSDTGTGDSRDFMETIRVSRATKGGEYLFYVHDWWNGAGSTNWIASGMKAYLYNGKTLVKTYTPPAGAGAYWVITYIVGSIIYDQNYLSN